MNNKVKKEDMLVYAVTDRSWLNGQTLYEQVEKALKGGATFVQLREKNLDRDAFIHEARDIKKLCAEYGVPFVINDDVDIAIAVDADGVHVGQDDMEAGNVRAKLGPDKIIGVSTHSVEEALLAQARGADYLGAGAVFSTSSKDNVSSLSHDTLRDICQSVSIPVVAIGGISEKNILQLSGTNVSGVAVISAIFANEDITKATKALKELAKEMVNA